MAIGSFVRRVRTNWSLSRQLTLMGGVIFAVSLLLPWQTSVEDAPTVYGIELYPQGVISIPPLIFVATVLLLCYVAWGRGLGWLTMLGVLFVGLILVMMGLYFSFFVGRVAQDDTIRLITGSQISTDTLQAGIGAYISLLSAVLILIGAIGGIVGTVYVRLRQFVYWLSN